jgi:hypothetical protein
MHSKSSVPRETANEHTRSISANLSYYSSYTVHDMQWISLPHDYDLKQIHADTSFRYSEILWCEAIYNQKLLER